MRLATFNTRNHHQRVDTTTAADLADWIDREAPDLLCLQEMTASSLRAVKELLERGRVIGVGRDDGVTGGEHVPVLLLNPEIRLLESGRFWLGPTPDIPSRGWFALCPRLCTWVVLQHQPLGDDPFLLCNQHWDHFSLYARGRGWRQVREFIRSRPEKRILVGGDFNVRPRSRLYRRMIAPESDPAFTDAWKQCHPHSEDATFRGWWHGWGRSRLDHWFIAGDWPKFDCWMGDWGLSPPSDHRPLFLDFTPQ